MTAPAITPRGASWPGFAADRDPAWDRLAESLTVFTALEKCEAEWSAVYDEAALAPGISHQEAAIELALRDVREALAGYRATVSS